MRTERMTYVIAFTFALTFLMAIVLSFVHSRTTGIVAVLSVNADATRIIGVEILDQNETPGLGGRVTNRSFLDQFNGERLTPDGIYVAVRGPGDTDPDNGKIDGITGATGTTRAFDRMLNRELRSLRQIVPDNVAPGSDRTS